jgi:hypothetical protein
MTRLTHALLSKGLMKIFATLGYRKTNPKRTQTKPISKIAKMHSTIAIQRTYDEIRPIYRQKNEAKTNPISTKSKNERKFFYNNGLQKYPPLGGKKNEPKTNPNSKNPKMFFPFS